MITFYIHTHTQKNTLMLHISSSVDTDFSRIMLNLLGYCLEIWLHQPEYKHLKILRGQVVFSRELLVNIIISQWEINNKFKKFGRAMAPHCI